MTRTLASASWFDLARHDVRSTMPAALQPSMQNGILERVFYDALLPEFLYPAIADNEPWQANMGDTQTKTRTGLLSPKTTPITGSDPSASTYGLEQWSVTMDQYGDAIDTNMLTSAMTLQSQFLRNIQTLGIGAGQSLNQLARNKLYGAYAGGRTYCTTAGTSDTALIVKDVSGFSTVLVNGVPTAVSSTNPLTVTIAGVANTVTGVNAGTLTLTLGTARVDVAGDYVVAANSPVSFRAGGSARNSDFDMTSADTATLALYRQAVVRLRKQNVPTVGGNYIAHITPDTESQLFADPDFKQAYQGRGDSAVYRDLSIGTFAGLDWVRNNETPVAVGGSGANVNIARTIVVGDGCLTGDPFADMGTLLAGTGVEGVPAIRMIGPATGVQVALIVRPPQDRLQQIVGSAWQWTGDFGIPSDVTANGADPARFKRAVVVEHIF